jgi:protein TonB
VSAGISDEFLQQAPATRGDIRGDFPGGEVLEGNAPVTDRLTTTLFLAALFHGIVILGVTFAAPFAASPPTPTLEVLLLTGPDSAAPDNASAQYLAQRSQQGSGTTDANVHPANPASSALPLPQQGIVEGNSDQYTQSEAGEHSTEFVSSRADRSDVSFRSGGDRPWQRAQTPLALAAAAPSPIVTNATDKTLRLRGRQDGKYEVIADTRESILAPYLDSWRSKIERLGTMNFPQVARQRAPTVNPVLEVAIRADGRLADIIVRRSSGRKEIDQAALSILRLASPFDPFPADVRKQYDQLRFAYEWQFLEGGSSGAVSVSAGPARTR